MNKLVVNYMRLRSAIGWTGMFLAGLVWLGGVFSGVGLQDSISAYWWTESRDVFVGVLFVAGALLCTYKGYDKVDRWVSVLAGICAFGIALFPTASGGNSIGYFQLSGRVTGVIHMVTASGFFLLLAYMSAFRFTKGKMQISKEKRRRNLIYRVTAVVMAGSIGVLAILMAVSAEYVRGTSIVFWLEAVMLVAFGVSWLTKGQTILQDVQDA